MSFIKGKDWLLKPYTTGNIFHGWVLT